MGVEVVVEGEDVSEDDNGDAFTGVIDVELFERGY